MRMRQISEAVGQVVCPHAAVPPGYMCLCDVVTQINWGLVGMPFWGENPVDCGLNGCLIVVKSVGLLVVMKQSRPGLLQKSSTQKFEMTSETKGAASRGGDSQAG